ncbi:hypothetical protein Back11_35600 [Paenibacillus baekrokdamisoli]|uniref:Uncharacterized protein n=1 Tax=Paenibacillus baekrokdamisoli TaxID=1712516 RepID=A0A3G9J1G8_9BACL|nr:hypothetical protein Back11_35600 [Paenibacillus baekrokdamisoli]
MKEMETMNVAPFTQWLVDVALRGESAGLKIDDNPSFCLMDTGYSEFNGRLLLISTLPASKNRQAADGSFCNIARLHN